jgi:hypothetical protein
MKQKQLVILLILVVALGAVGYYLRQQEGFSKGGSPALGKKLFGELPINDVTQISIKHGTDELTLAKKDNLWRVRERNEYPANFADISDFLIKAKDIKIAQLETVGPSHLDRFGLAPGQGSNAPTIVDLRDKDAKLVKSFSLGKKHMKKSDRPSPFGDMGEEGFPDGRYVKLNDSDSVALVSEPFSSIEPKPENWVNKDFFKVEKIRSIATTFPAQTNSWKVTRDTESGEWKLADAKKDEKLDSGKTSGLGNALSSPNFSDVVVNAKPEQIGMDKPTTVTIDTFDNFTYTLKVGEKTNDNYSLMLTVAAQIARERTPAKDEKKEDKEKLDKEFRDKQKKLEDKLAQEKGYEKWIYLVSSWSLEPVMKERSGLLADKKDEKKDEAKKDDAAETDKKDEPAPAASAPVAPAAPASAPTTTSASKAVAPAAPTAPK